jgi:hypothetical protein
MLDEEARCIAKYSIVGLGAEALAANSGECMIAGEVTGDATNDDGESM